MKKRTLRCSFFLCFLKKLVIIRSNEGYKVVCMKLRKIIMLLICFLMVIFQCSLMPIHAQEKIRVGCVDLEKFLTVHSDGTVSGYGAEFLEEIKKYTGWDYEFVQGTWEECLKWLESDKIDLLIPAQYSKERAERFLYSDTPCCQDYVALIALEERDDLYFDDPQSYENLTIGMIRENYLNLIFEDYVEQNQIHIQRQYFDDLTELNKALEEKKVDLIVNGSMNNYSQKKYIAKIGTLPAYFITSQKKQKLMAELNEALVKIELNHPYYIANLHEKYYGDSNRKSIGFTKQEQQYILEHPELTIALKDNDYPLEYYDEEDGTYKGILVDLLDLISENSGIRFKIVRDSNLLAWDMVKTKQADLILSSTISQSLKNQYHMKFTDSYYTMVSSLVAHKKTQINVNDHLKVAMLSSEPGMISTTSDKYSHWEIVQYPSMKECLEALSRKEVDGVLASTLYLHSHQVFKQYTELMEVLPRIVETPLSLGTLEDNDEILISILNKAIHKMSDNDVDAVVVENMLNHSEDISFGYFIRNYPLIVIVVCGMIIGLIVFAVLEFRFNHMILKKNQLLKEKNNALLLAKEKEKTLKEEVKMDALSGLLNKVYAKEMMESLLAEHKGTCMLIDIDHFKNINDSYGHMSGDRVIQEFGSLLKRCCRRLDVVGRVGGDEFVVFFVDVCDQQIIAQKAEMIMRESKEITGNISCSIGIAFYPEDASSYEDLYECADQALYYAKSLGRACYYFYHDIQRKER